MEERAESARRLDGGQPRRSASERAGRAPQGGESAGSSAESGAAGAGQDDLQVLARLLREEDATSSAAELDAHDEQGATDADPSAHDDDGVFLVAGRFEIVAQLGEGVHGRVLRARDHSNHRREVALKILNRDENDAAGTIDLEARAREWLAQTSVLTHGSINRLREVGRTEDGRVWLSSDLVEGESARKLAERTGALPPRHALEIVRQVLLGLEQGHELGLVHGRLNAENVALVRRVAWTDDNPFGVGVRIRDYGLATNLDPSSPPAAVSTDLTSAGLLLAELLTGARFAPDGSDWIGSAASVSTAGMSVRARAMLDRALARETAVRFPSAAAFRSELERTPEWRTRSANRPLLLAGGALTLIIVAAATATVVLSRGETSVAAADLGGEPPAAEADPTTNDAALDLERNTAAWEAERLAYEARLDELNRTVVHSRSELERLRDERDRAQAENASRDEAPPTQPVQSTPVDDPTRSVGESIAAENPATRAAAAAVDRVLDALVTDDLERTRDYANANIAHADGRDFFVALADAFRALDELDREPGLELRLDRIRAVRGAVDHADTLGRALLTAAPAWASLADASPVRGLRIENALDEMHAQRERLESELKLALDAFWSDAQEHPDRAPRDLVRAADYIDDGRLAGFLERYVEWLTARVLPSGVLRRPALAGVDSLPAWGDLVAGNGLELATETRETILALSFARAFYATPDAPLPRVPDSIGEPPAGDWREQLGLRAGLLDPAAGVPGPIGSRRLYFARTADGAETWRWDEVELDPEPPTVASHSRLVVQRFHDAEGVPRGERKLRVYCVGRRLFEEDVRHAELIDLASPDERLVVRTWRSSGAPMPPARLLLAPGTLTAFRQRIESENVRCLVRENGSARTWWSPRFGLVRHADPDLITYELVFAE